MTEPTTPATSEAKPNGRTHEPRAVTGADLPSNWATFIGERKVLALLGITAYRFRGIVATGRLVRYLVPDGSIRYNPAEVETLRIELQGDELDDGSDDAADEKAGASTVRAGTGLLRQTQGHLERMMRLYEGPMRTLMAAQQEEINSLREHSRQAAQQRIDMLKVHEELLSERHMRDLATSAVEREAKLKSELFGLVKDALPKIVDGIKAGAAAKDPKHAAQIAAAVELLTKEVKREDLETLLATEFFSERARGLIKTILDPQPQTKE